eukprot:454912_1
MSTNCARPNKALSDIIVNPDDCNKKDIPSIPVMVDVPPSMIICDWLYLGNCQTAMNLVLLNKMGITHILNVTQNITCFHIFSDIKYAQIPIEDATASNLYDYLEAACSFIDECNPFYYHKNQEVIDEMNNNLDWKPPKILIHCAAGISRSATITIAYLMTRTVRYNYIEKNKLKFIAEQLKYNENSNKLLRLSEAYYYVKSCRFIIQPNGGFIDQLQQFEKLYNAGESTKTTIDYQSRIPSATANMASRKIPIKRAEETTQCKYCVVL